MNDHRKVHVTLEPRSPTPRLFSAADLQAALKMVRERIPPSASRFTIRMDASTPEQDYDVVVCVPVTLFENRRAHGYDNEFWPTGDAELWPILRFPMALGAVGVCRSAQDFALR